MNWKVIVPVMVVSILLGVAIWWYLSQEDEYYATELPAPTAGPRVIDGSEYVFAVEPGQFSGGPKPRVRA
jgi:hypothetical protein